MAEQISKIKRLEIPEEVIQERNMDEVVKAVSENKEAILKGVTLLSTLNESGGLDIVNALVKHRDTALEKFINEINKETYAGTLENMTELLLLAGSLDVGDIQYFINKLNAGMREAKAVDDDATTSYIGMVKALKDPDINRTITMSLELLRGMGKE